MKSNLGFFQPLFYTFFGALLTFLIYSSIERMKIKESFKSEFNKISIQKIGETWEFLNVLNDEFDEMAQLQRKLIDYKDTSSSAFKRDFYRFNYLNKSAIIDDDEYYNLVRNKFWIGKTQYNIAKDFLIILIEKQNALKNKDYDTLKEINERLDDKTLELEDAVDSVIKRKR